MKKTLLLSILAFTTATTFAQKEKPVKRGTSASAGVIYTITNENELHDATWLQWPHQYQFGAIFCKRLEATWAEMTVALSTSEKVNIIAYDDSEKTKIAAMLKTANATMSNVSIKIMPTDDFWARDNGPIFARNKNGDLTILDFAFNGWGKKQKYTNCDQIPAKIATDQGLPLIDMNAQLTIEGSSIQMDRNGTMMATKSSILNSNRNIGKNQVQVEQILKKNIGATHFIWLKGTSSADETDFHIDTFARFANDSTIITMENEDLAEWKVPDSDIEVLNDATNEIEKPYTFVKLPLTKKPVTTAYGKNLGYRVSYLGYYVANTVVLVPNFNDDNDAIANDIIQKIYPDKKIVGIDIRNLFAEGASLHNVCRDQPKKSSLNSN
jgi:agmatine deiminase